MKILVINLPKYDLSTSMLVHGLRQLDGIELRFANLGNCAEEHEVLNGADAIAYGNERADVVVACSRLYTFPWIDARLAGKIAAKKKVFLDGTDDGAIDLGPRQFKDFEIIFKRDIYLRDDTLRNFVDLLFPFEHSLWEVTKAHKYIPFPNIHSLKNNQTPRHLIKGIFSYRNRSKIFPLPLCCFDYMFQDFNKNPSFELSCVYRPHSNSRRMFLEYVRKLNLPRSFIGEIKLDRNKAELVHPLAMHPQLANENATGLWMNMPYFEQLHNSRACISLPGAGFYGFSFWEILGAGSLLITKRIAVELPEPFIENEHYLAFDTPEEFEDKIGMLYSKPKLIDEIRRNGQEHAREHHTPVERAKRFCKVVESRRVEGYS